MVSTLHIKFNVINILNTVILLEIIDIFPHGVLEHKKFSQIYLTIIWRKLAGIWFFNSFGNSISASFLSHSLRDQHLILSYHTKCVISVPSFIAISFYAIKILPYFHTDLLLKRMSIIWKKKFHMYHFQFHLV